NSREPRKDVEIAASLRLELDGFPSEARLRDLWLRAGLLGSGVLFGPGKRDSDQGLKELVALSSASQAFQLVSGTMTDQDTTSDNASGDESAEPPHPTADAITTSLASVFAALASFGGVALVDGGSKYGALAGGLVGLGTSLGLTTRWSWTRKQTQGRTTTFV